MNYPSNDCLLQHDWETKYIDKYELLETISHDIDHQEVVSDDEEETRNLCIEHD